MKYSSFVFVIAIPCGPADELRVLSSGNARYLLRDDGAIPTTSPNVARASIKLSLSRGGK